MVPWLGDALSAQRWQRWLAKLVGAAKRAFWNEARGLFADELMHSHFSEHTQCLALLAGVLEGEQEHRTAQNLLSDPALTRTTIYFTHYLFAGRCAVNCDLIEGDKTMAGSVDTSEIGA